MLASSVVRLGVRHKLIIVGVLVILVVSSAFTWINLALARRAIEEDLKTRAIVYAREIAATLSVTLATVKSHLVRIYAKLGATNRNECLGRAVSLGLLK